MKLVKSFLKIRWLSSLAFLAVMFIITGLVNPDFFTYSNIIECFNSSVVFTLLAVGAAFVIMTGEIDVSIGSTMGLAAAIAGMLAQQGQSLGLMIAAEGINSVVLPVIALSIPSNIAPSPTSASPLINISW